MSDNWKCNNRMVILNFIYSGSDAFFFYMYITFTARYKNDNHSKCGHCSSFNAAILTDIAVQCTDMENGLSY